MPRDLLSPVRILDATHGSVARIASPWLGVFWILVAPSRLAQAWFVRELAALGLRAGDYGPYLEHLAWVNFGLFVPAVLGRFLYVRACTLGLQSGRGVGREGLRIPPAQLANALYGSLVVELLFLATAWMFVWAPLVGVLSGLAVVAATRTERPGLLRPVLEMLRLLSGVRTLAVLAPACAAALLVAFLNIYMAMRALLWAATAVGGDDAARWDYLLRPLIPGLPVIPGELLTGLICGALALLVVEPFWLAALTGYAQSARQRQAGEDLRRRFRLLTERR